MTTRDFTVYFGKFPCKECGEEVKSLRLWSVAGEATWMCPKKHLSKVDLVPKKKKKKDYDND